MEKVENQILMGFPLPKVKSEILEILLDTDGISEDIKIEKLSKTNRGKYLSFRVYLPYTKIVRAEGLDLQIFVAYFFEALEKVLMPYGITSEQIEVCKKSVVEESLDKEEYRFTISEPQKKWREAAKTRRLTRQAKAVVK